MSAAPRRRHRHLAAARTPDAGKVYVDVTAMASGEVMIITRPPADGFHPAYGLLFQLADFVIEIDGNGHARLLDTDGRQAS